MNSNLITEEKESKSMTCYLTLLANEVNTQASERLINLADKIYKGNLSPEQINEMCAMSYTDKLWLIAQYEEEVEYNTPPNFDHLY